MRVVRRANEVARGITEPDNVRRYARTHFDQAQRVKTKSCLFSSTCEGAFRAVDTTLVLYPFIFAVHRA